MNNVHGKTIFTQNRLSIPFKKLDFLRRMGSFFPVGHKGKKLLFPNPCGQLLQNFLCMFS
jgi:hypothetical protein